MNLLKNWKKAAVVARTAVMVSGSVTVPALAHGHHGSSYRGTYCSYHHTTHRYKTSCSKYCSKHGTTHAKGKVHHTNHH